MYTLNQTEVHAVAYLVFDARGNGGGSIAPTITGDHQNRITDYTAVVVKAYEDIGEGRRYEYGGKKIDPKRML